VKAGTKLLVAGAKVGEAKLAAAWKKKVRVIDERTLEGMMRGEIAVQEVGEAVLVASSADE